MGNTNHAVINHGTAAAESYGKRWADEVPTSYVRLTDIHHRRAERAAAAQDNQWYSIRSFHEMSEGVVTFTVRVSCMYGDTKVRVGIHPISVGAKDGFGVVAGADNGSFAVTSDGDLYQAGVADANRAVRFKTQGWSGTAENVVVCRCDFNANKLQFTVNGTTLPDVDYVLNQGQPPFKYAPIVSFNGPYHRWPIVMELLSVEGPGATVAQGKPLIDNTPPSWFTPQGPHNLWQQYYTLLSAMPQQAALGRLNILLLGMPGRGKSSFVNAILSACREGLPANDVTRDLVSQEALTGLEGTHLAGTMILEEYHVMGNIYLLDFWGLANQPMLDRDVNSLLNGHVKMGASITMNGRQLPAINSAFWNPNPTPDDRIHAILVVTEQMEAGNAAAVQQFIRDAHAKDLNPPIVPRICHQHSRTTEPFEL